MSDWQPWCRVRWVDHDGRLRDAGGVGGRGRPDLHAVDRLVRLLLALGRLGLHPQLVAVTPQLAELLDLVGLGDLVVEMEGEAEGGEEALGVEHGQEEGHLGDGAV